MGRVPKGQNGPYPPIRLFSPATLLRTQSRLLLHLLRRRKERAKVALASLLAAPTEGYLHEGIDSLLKQPVSLLVMKSIENVKPFTFSY